MKKISYLLIIILFYSGSFLRAQMSGSYTVPGSFNAIAVAINNINQFGVIGPVTINIAAGYTETAVPGGYSIFTVVGASSTNSILIQRSGTGSSPVVYSYTNGSYNSLSPRQDGMLSLIGADYITIDGLSFIDVNTTNPATMDYGIGFFRASGSNGCQFNTIKNCTISLNANNDITPNGVGGSGSKGIYGASNLINSLTSSLSVTQPEGGNSYNKFYGNTILNCNSGISLLGPSLLLSSTTDDRYNDIGGSSTATGNQILNFGNAGSNSLAYGIFVEMQSRTNISYNYLNSNNGGGSFHANSVAGIASGLSARGLETINHNTITVSVADINSSATAISNGGTGTYYGDTVEIRHNVIENCNSHTLTSGYFGAIGNYVNCKQIFINDNVLSNNGFYYNYSTGQNFYHELIRNYSSVSEWLSISGNTITAWDKSPVSKNAAGLYAISVDAYSTVGSRIDINNNHFSNFIYDNTNVALLSYIYVGVTASTLQVNNNTWNNLSLNHGYIQQLIDIKSARYMVTANNRIVGSYARAHRGSLTCYNSNSYTGSFRYHEYVYGNDFSNISCATGTVSTGASFSGINCGGTSAILRGYKHVYNNIISNVTYTVNSTFSGITVGDLAESDSILASAVHHNTVTGISIQGAVTGLSVFGVSDGLKGRVFENKIQNLTSTSGTVVTGLGITAFLNGAEVFKNRISDLSTSSPSAQVNGISVITCSNVNVYNNLIGNISAPNSTVSYGLAGIKVFANTGNIRFDHNTVYMSGSTASNVSSGAITVTTGVNLILRNNILVNLTTPSGTGIAVAYKRSSTSLATYDALSNNNLFYAGVPSANHVLFHDGTPYTTLGNFKALAGYRDINSVTENPTFASTLGSAANFLDLSTSVATQAESGGVAINGITDDYAGTARSVIPDIGAWEDAFISAGDSTAPVILANGFSNDACNTALRTFTAQLSDAGGVAGGLLAPRMYYRINSGSYISTTSTLTSGTATLGTWSFNLFYSAVPGDVISYFLVAQDNSSSAHVLSTAPSGFAAVDVNTVSQFPTAVQTFTLKTALSGVYTVGASQTFTTLSAAATAYNNSCLAGPVTFSLTDALYGALETFPIEFRFHPDASSTNSLLIIPAAGTAAVIQPTAGAPACLVKLYDARYIEFNGINSGGSSLSVLTAATANTLSSCANLWLASGSTTSGSGCQNISIRNLTIKGIGDGAENIGILAGTHSTTPFNVLSGQDNDNITISGNTFLKFRHAILAIGKRDTSFGGYDNWNIVSNIFGPATPGANAVATGVRMAMSSKVRIESNIFQNHVITYTGTPVLLELNVKNFSVKGNSITNVTYTGTSLPDYIGAIEIGSNVRKGTIEHNVIYSVKGPTGIRGIRINTTLYNSELNILNNFVSSCIGNYQYIASACMEVTSSSGGLKIIHNTFAQSGTVAATNSSTGFSALHIANAYTTQASGLEVTNNIFYNTFDNSSINNEYIYALSCEVPPTIFSTLNYNNYFTGTSGGLASLGMLQGSSVYGLANMIAGFGQNLNSTSKEPFFTSASDLHISQANPMNYFMDDLGGPSTVTVDIDVQSRNISTPDVGADEFTYTTSCSSASAGVVTPTLITLCQNTPFTLQSYSMSTGIGISYQWKIFSSSAGTYTDVTVGQGATGTIYQGLMNTPGAHNYMLTATCVAGSGTLTGNSNVVTVSITPGPNLMILPTPTVLCSGKSVTLQATGATNYYWNPGPFTSSIVITQTASTVYEVTGYIPGCNSVNTITKTIYYSITPVLTVSPTSSTVCVGSPVTLTATGAQTYTWNGSAGSDTFVALPLANTNYSVLGMSAHGCTASANSTISVSTGPTLTITGNQAVCAGVGTTLTASGAATYSWTSGATTSAAIVSPLTNSTYTVLGYNVSGCPGVATVAVVSNSVPVLLIQSSAASVCVNSPATFTVSGANTYSWNTNSSSSILTVTPSAAGIYTVSGTNSAGCASTASVTLGTYSLPVVSITTSSNGVCAGTSLTLSASGANSYSWQAGPNSASFVVTPAANTTYTVLATESIHNCSNLAVTNITVNPLPALVISWAGAGVCDGNAASYTVSGAATYSWSTGSATNTMTLLPATTGTYNVSGITAFGCVNTLTFALAVYPVPTVAVMPLSQTVCAGSPAAYTASGALNYVWNASSPGSVYQVNPTANAVYTVVGTSAQGCASAQTASVFVKPVPVFSFAPTSNTLCAGSSGSFVASGATSYTWNNGVQGSIFSYTAQLGASTFTVSGTNTLGCSNSATVSVHILSLPVIQITPSNTMACIGDQLDLQANGASSYTWMPGGNTGSSLSFSISVPVSYTLTGLSSEGCEQTTGISISADACTSIAELGEKLLLGIYPNPSNGKVTVWKQGAGKAELRIFSADGKLIQQWESEADTYELDLSRFAKGLYFVSMSHNNSIYQSRLVIQ